MANGFELCAVDGEDDLGQRSGAAAAEHVHGEALDDKKKDEADRDLGATMSDLVRRHSGSGAIVCVWSHILEGMRRRAPETRTHDRTSQDILMRPHYGVGIGIPSPTPPRPMNTECERGDAV